MKKLTLILTVVAILMAINKSSNAQQGLWSANGNNIVYTNRLVGVGLNNPAYKLDVNGRAHFTGNVFADSSITAMHLYAIQKVTTDALYVNNLAVFGNKITIDGANDKISATGGKITFENTGVEINGNLETHGNSLFDGTMDVNGNSKITGNSEVTVDLTVGGTINAANLNITNTNFENITVNNNTRTGSLFVRDNLFFEGSGTNKISVASQNLMFVDTKVGFGISPDPLYTVNIGGDAHISGYLYVTQGVIIGQRIKGERGDVDTIKTKEMEVAEKIRSREILTEKIVTDTVQTLKMELLEMKADSIFAEKMEAVLTKAEIGQIRELTSEKVMAEKEVKVSTITIDGLQSKIYSTSGVLDFNGNNFSNVGTVNANTISANNMNVSYTGFDSLHVQNKIKIGNSIVLELLTAPTGPKNHIYTTDGSGSLFIQSQNYNQNTIINANNNGNVGIGTTGPNAKFQVVGYSVFTSTTSAINSAAYIRGLNTYSIATTPDYTWYHDDLTGIFHPADNNIGFTIGGTEKMRITGLGYVGIGTTSPNNLLQVQGLINFDNTKYSTFLGYQTGNSNTGYTNTAIGFQALKNNTTGSHNIANGSFALYSNTKGSLNIAIGYALFDNITGSQNTAIGYNALYSNTTGRDNIAIGIQALVSNNSSTTTNGCQNTAVGNYALTSNTTGTNNTALGYGANVNSNNLNNATAIGAGAYVGASNSLVLGSINGINGATASTNVGIGTTSPTAKLYIKSDGATSATVALSIANSSSTNLLYVRNDGSVGIGTTNFDKVVGSTTIQNYYKLAVLGKVHAQEVVVNTGWSDFVFNEDYKLKSLSEVEQYIKENKKLPDVPSADEVAKNGVPLGQTQSLLLQKIEELTIYIIEQNKKIEEQNKRIEALETQNK